MNRADFLVTHKEFLKWYPVSEREIPDSAKLHVKLRSLNKLVVLMAQRNLQVIAIIDRMIELVEEHINDVHLTLDSTGGKVRLRKSVRENPNTVYDQLTGLSMTFATANVDYYLLHQRLISLRDAFEREFIHDRTADYKLGFRAFCSQSISLRNGIFTDVYPHVVFAEFEEIVNHYVIKAERKAEKESGTDDKE